MQVSGGVFVSAADRQRIEALLRRGKRSGLCSGDVPTIAELVDRADDKMFEKVLCNPHHVLYNSLPNETVSFYELRHRPHNRELINKTSRLAEASFIVRMLYKNTHFFTILLLRSLNCFISMPTTLYRCYFAFCQNALNEYEYELLDFLTFPRFPDKWSPWMYMNVEMSDRECLKREYMPVSSDDEAKTTIPSYSRHRRWRH